MFYKEEKKRTNRDATRLRKCIIVRNPTSPEQTVCGSTNNISPQAVCTSHLCAAALRWVTGNIFIFKYVSGFLDTISTFSLQSVI